MFPSAISQSHPYLLFPELYHMIQTKEQAFQILAKHGITPPPALVYKHSMLGMPIQEFMGTQCYLTKNQLMPTYQHVDLILDILLYPEKYNLPHFFTILYSTIKKSIKTTISAIVARWIQETWADKQECIFLASDAEQSKGRGYAAFKETIELHPNYDPDKRILYSPYRDELWRLTDRHGIYLPTNGEVKPVSSDYAGESGANPTATFYTELWAWRLSKDEKLWSEMTVPPTRPRGFRWVDTYAGYTGESSVLWALWRRLKEEGYQLTIDDIPQWGEIYPDETHLPIYIHLPSRTIGYIDQGIRARRFPWQQGEQGEVYYQQERAAALTEADYLRLHENEWVEPTQALMPIQWWDNALDTTIPPSTEKEPCIIGVDASVTHDCTAMSRVSRHPVYHQETVLREEAVWDPEKLGHEMDYDRTILPQLVMWRRRYNIVNVVYDKHQLAYLMTRIAQGSCKDIPMPDGSLADLPALPTREFNQNSERLISDGMLVTMIRDRKHHHTGDCPITRDHILNAIGRHAPHENTRLRIEKRDDNSKIDAVVADSMANLECTKLAL